MGGITGREKREGGSERSEGARVRACVRERRERGQEEKQRRLPEAREPRSLLLPRAPEPSMPISAIAGAVVGTGAGAATAAGGGFRGRFLPRALVGRGTTGKRQEGGA